MEKLSFSLKLFSKCYLLEFIFVAKFAKKMKEAVSTSSVIILTNCKICIRHFLEKPAISPQNFLQRN